MYTRPNNCYYLSCFKLMSLRKRMQGSDPSRCAQLQFQNESLCWLRPCWCVSHAELCMQQVKPAPVVGLVALMCLVLPSLEFNSTIQNPFSICFMKFLRFFFSAVFLFLFFGLFVVYFSSLFTLWNFFSPAKWTLPSNNQLLLQLTLSWPVLGELHKSEAV